MTDYEKFGHWTTWAKDIGIGLGFIATTVGSMWMLNQLALWCEAWGVCA